MTVHYLTLNQLAEKFNKALSKKELKAQAVGSTIFVHDERIVILPEKVNNPAQKEKKIKPIDNQ